jgi:Ca2+-binding RTX toxin-like protein
MSNIYNPNRSSTVTGTSGADMIYGLPTVGIDPLLVLKHEKAGRLDNDTINGGGGDDYIQIGPGSDSINGGAGSDQLTFYNYNPSAGNFGWNAFLVTYADVLAVQFPNPIPYVYQYRTLSVTVDLQAGTYIQKVEGRAIRDTTKFDTHTFSGQLTSIESLEGTFGNDRFLGSSARVETYSSGPGADFIDGRGGWDFISLYADSFNFNFPNKKGVVVDFNTGTIKDPWGFTDTFKNIEEVDGTNLADIFIGDNKAQYWSSWLGDDKLDGGGGNDTIYSGEGNDTVGGGSGDDIVYGWEGDDTVTGGAGRDILSVWIGDDSVNGGTGNDIILGGAGTDTLHGGDDSPVLGDAISGEAGDDKIYGDAGSDFLLGGAGDDKLYGGTGDDVVAGDSGQKVINFANPAKSDFTFELEIVAPGDDTLDGGAGNDTAEYLHAAQAVKASLRTKTATGEGKDTLLNIENLIGSRFNDFLEGDDNANNLIGGAGDDDIRGFGGDDTIVGSSGKDFVDGGDGRDIVAFDSALVLQLKSETVSATVYRLEAVLGSTAGTRGDVYLNIEEFVGSADNDVIKLTGSAPLGVDGKSGKDTLTGGTGSDNLKGGNDDDIINGGAGRDNLEGNAGNDRLTGGSGDDRLLGGTGKDTLAGNDGNDRLDGGIGRDILSGGKGNDRFEFTASVGAGNADAIEDFGIGDKIVLENSIFRSVGSRLAASAFVVGSASVGREDHIIYEKTTGSLYYDPDGVGGRAAMLFAALDTRPTLDAGDFLVI